MHSLVLLALLTSATPAAAAPDLLDPGRQSSYCATTGFCVPQQARGPHPGTMFLATGLVAAGVWRLRRRERPGR